MELKMNINKRLQTVSSFVTDGSNIIDIGCDHALLDIYLALNKKNLNIIASDNKEGPLKHAKENVSKYQLDNQIKIKLGDGIATIEENTDTIIISGMGGLNIVGILKYKKDEYKNVNTLILSPNNYTEKVRKEIAKLGFYIDDETLVKDKNIIYPVIVFKRGKKRYNKTELLLGPILINNQTEIFKEYIKKEKDTKEKLLSLLPKKYLKRRLELKRELKLINKV